MSKIIEVIGLDNKHAYGKVNVLLDDGTEGMLQWVVWFVKCPVVVLARTLRVYAQNIIDVFSDTAIQHLRAEITTGIDTLNNTVYGAV